MQALLGVLQIDALTSASSFTLLLRRRSLRPSVVNGALSFICMIQGFPEILRIVRGLWITHCVVGLVPAFSTAAHGASAATVVTGYEQRSSVVMATNMSSFLLRVTANDTTV